MLTRDDILAAYAAGPETIITLVLSQQEMLVALDSRVQALEARLAQASHNSNQPPSSDGLSKKPTSLRPRSGKPPGGQTGHRGTTLCWSAVPDQVLQHSPASCSGCGTPLQAVAACGTQRRQVHELPPLAWQVVEHQSLHKVCPHCQHRNAGQFPAAVTQAVQYGAGVKALCVYLQQYQLLPFARTCQLLQDLFGGTLCQGTLATSLATCHERLAPVEAAIAQTLRQAPVVHFDETGLRIAGRLAWLHSMGTGTLTYYAAHAQRGRLAFDAIGLLAGFKGVAVHDGWASYWGYADCAHALCNAHLLRELIALEEQQARAATAAAPGAARGPTWPAQLRALLLEIKARVALTRAAGGTRLSGAWRHRFTARYVALWTDGVAISATAPAQRRPGQRGRLAQTPAQNLLDRLAQHQDAVLRFMTNLAVPFDNNLAERDLRMAKVRQKISGCFRSAAGAAQFCRIRGYISTLRKQGYAVLRALASVFDGTPHMPILAT